ncbi:MAG: HAD family phosphatase [Candidatus Aenigmatarchaeota archaeon]
MIKNIIFDVGGVFIKGNSEEFFKKVSKRGLSLRKGCENIKWDDVMTGKESLPDFFRRIFNQPIDDNEMEKIIDIWVKNWKIDAEMIRFAKKLRKKYSLYILSNADSEGFKRSKNAPKLDFFDKKFISFEIGLAKPDIRIYQHVLKEIGAKPEECVFIDDKDENVEAAKKIGIHGIVFSNKENLINDLEKIGVKI